MEPLLGDVKYVTPLDEHDFLLPVRLVRLLFFAVHLADPRSQSKKRSQQRCEMQFAAITARSTSLTRKVWVRVRYGATT